MSNKSVAPRVEVFRSQDGMEFTFMDLACVDAGHLVGWGELCTMTREQAVGNAKDHIIRSMAEFPSRNGNDRKKRANLKGKEKLYIECERVSVKLVSPKVLEFTPYYRESGRQMPLSDKALTLATDVAPKEFFVKLEEAFQPE